jgi:murein DD-endopeptidase MepM/ murein hydrolase activator NlpD
VTPRFPGLPALAGALAAVCAALPSAAGAQATGAGGAVGDPPPVLDSVTCRTACAGLDRARTGSAVHLAGSDLEGVRHVVFLGGRGTKDDVGAPVAAAGPAAVDVAVPAGARSGPVVAIDAAGRRSTRRTIRITRATRTPAVQARVDARRVFVGAARKAAVSFFVGGSRPSLVAVALRRRGSTTTLASWMPGVVAPGSVGTVEWDGLVGGQPAPEGRYEFVVATSGGEASAPAGAQAAQAGAPTARSSFLLLAHRFPVAGPHTIGEGQAAFGGGRGHEGQDVFAACGTPLVAAVGGTVKHVAFHERAGNYVVIAGDDGFDYAYMHLQKPTPLRDGAAVATGDAVGAVGDTGRASGCHLHLEMWTAPGWYTGGKPVDPLPRLRSWDAGA